MNSDEDKELCDALNLVEAMNPTNNISVIEPFNINSDIELFNATDRVEAAININNKEACKQFLQKHFGFNDFRDFQWKIIQSVIVDKRDNFVIMSTGYGKSLCYQFPSLWKLGLTIVISPLISLMRDQVSSLNQRRIPATFLGSAQPDSRRICDQLINTNYYRIVYMCPEFLIRNKSLIKSLQAKLTLIAIDEAHCVSHWGHDFRPEYQQLGELRRLVPNVPIMAATATATECVRREIEASLYLRNPQFTCTGFDRSNLELHVEPLNNCHRMIRRLAGNVVGSIIVYCPSRANTEKIAESLKKDNIECDFYHAGIEKTKRSKIEESFMEGRLKLIISTCAFGMGIDKADVRYVLHYRAVKSIEQYYQEIGRAGRDGKPSKCIIFFERSDVAKYLVRMTNEKLLKNASPYARRNRHLLGSYFEQYLISERCRRLNILQYFEGLSVNIPPRSDCCDNCSTGKSNRYTIVYRNMDEQGFFDFTHDSRILLNLIHSNPHGMLRSRINSRQQNILNHHDDSYWAGILDILERLKYVKTSFVEMPSESKQSPPELIKLDRLGLDWIATNQLMKFQLQPFDKLTRYVEVKTLKASKQSSVQPLFSTNVVFTNSSKRGVQNMVQILKVNPYPVQIQIGSITNLHRDVMDLINEKLSIPEIEKRLSLSRSTVTGFVCTLLQNGYPIAKKDLERLYGIFANVFQSIWTKLPTNIFERNVVRSTKSKLPGVSCDQMRLVLCYRYPRDYLNRMGLNFYDPDGIPFSATQFVLTTIPHVQNRMSSFINRLFGGCHPIDMEYSDQSSDEENKYEYDETIDDEDGEDSNDSKEFTQENLSDHNDEVVMGWDDLVR